MYRKLALAISINAVLMFLITYVNLSSTGHFFPNVNRAYMALLMAAPMVVIMLLVMRSMFENRRMNAVLHAAAAVVIVVLLVLIRRQVPIGDGQFLRSMIPHHSSAVLMCTQASIEDPEIEDLCDRIIKTQLEEIREMKAILERD